jgi:tetratricopeptide (TPR) repeat protein
MAWTHADKKMTSGWCAIVLGVLLNGALPLLLVAQEEQVPTLAELIDQAEALRIAGRWSQAIVTLEQVVDRRAEDEALAATAQILIGRYYLESNRPAQAGAAFQDAIDQFPSQNEAQFKGRLFTIDARRALGQFDQAMAAAADLLSHPGLTAEEMTWTAVKRAEVGLTAMYFGKGPRAPVINELNQLLAGNTGDTSEPHNWARIRLSELLYHDRRFDQSIIEAEKVVADFNQAKATDEQASWALFWKGCCQIDAGSPEQAVTTLQSAYGLASGKHPYIACTSGLRLAMAHRASQHHSAALTGFTTALNDAIGHNLEESLQDQARLEVGTAFDDLNMRNRAIAWLRKGIEDPSEMDETDGQLADQIAGYMTGPEKEAWRLYLVSPVDRDDPTSPYVESEFNEQPSHASNANVTRASIRLCWLGDFYLEQKQYDQAIQAYQDAMASAATAEDRTRSGIGQLRAMRRLAFRLYYKTGDRRTARQLEEQAATLTASLMPDWIEIVLTGSVGDAHYAVEQAAHSYGMWQRNSEALSAVEQIIQQLELADAEDVRMGFARYIKMQVLAWLEMHHEAIVLSEQIDADYQGSGNPVLENIRVSAMIRASRYYAKVGQAEQGESILNSIRSEHPEGTFDEALDKFTDLIQNN